MEFNNSGEGAAVNQRVSWAHQLSAIEADDFSIQNVLGTTYKNQPKQDNWNPIEVIEEVNSNL